METTIVYDWRSGSHHAPGLSAQEAGAELERIRQKHGSLTAEAVVDAARDESSVLHSSFDWDDTVAAENWRRSQARTLIASIVITPVEQKELTAPVRLYHNVKKDYKPLSVILKTPDYRDELLKNAMRDLETFRNKYASLSMLDPVFRAIDGLDRDALRSGGKD